MQVPAPGLRQPRAEGRIGAVDRRWDYVCAVRQMRVTVLFTVVPSERLEAWAQEDVRAAQGRAAEDAGDALRGLPQLCKTKFPIVKW